MNAEIIAVGSELLTPNRLDTNSLFLTEQLNRLGVEVTRKTVVGDDRRRLAEAVRGALDRATILILTGGLGPTEDDVTREAVAAALDLKIVFHQEIFDWIEQRFRRANRKIAEINRRQAFLIEGAEALPNDNGTAPGQWIEHLEHWVILLPGPPNELKAMFARECLPRLEHILPKQVIRTLQFRVAGMAESDLDQLISEVYKKYENPATTILAAPGDIQIHLRARCATGGEATALLNEVGAQIEKLLGDRIYSQNGDPLEQVIGNLLRARGATLSVAESCTGGLLAGRITDIPGSSDYFLGGFLVYTNRMKTQLLGVNPGLLEQHGAVSEPVADAMARGARVRTGSTFALSITGVAGPTSGTEAAPVGTVVIGLADTLGGQTRRFRFLGDRGRVRLLAAQNALDLLRRKLLAAGSNVSD
jgi:nicotinamide-nucleotide amidase